MQRFVAGAGLLVILSGCAPRLEQGQVPPMMDSSTGPEEVEADIHPACRVDIISDGHVPSISTDRLEYRFRSEPMDWILIAATYTNTGADTVYIGPYNSATSRLWFERRLARGWMRTYVPAGILDPGPPTPVPPGATVADTLRVFHFELQSGVIHRVALGCIDKETGISGEYRIRYTIHEWYRQWNDRGPVLPPEASFSNTFRIVVE
jgi:hypothetical protein